jgi:hypothetical protein
MVNMLIQLGTGCWQTLATKPPIGLIIIKVILLLLGHHKGNI